jgi:hypothetical protein
MGACRIERAIAAAILVIFLVALPACGHAVSTPALAGAPASPSPTHVPPTASLPATATKAPAEATATTVPATPTPEPSPTPSKTPTIASGVAGSLPVMADARGTTAESDMITYDTASGPADIVTFYQKEMAKVGWKQVGEPSEANGLTTLQFTKGAQILIVSIVSSGGHSTVMVMVL